MAGNQLPSNETPLLKAECEALAKLIAQQPHALELKADFDLIFAEARSQVIFEELRQRTLTSVTKLISQTLHQS